MVRSFQTPHTPTPCSPPCLSPLTASSARRRSLTTTTLPLIPPLSPPHSIPFEIKGTVVTRANLAKDEDNTLRLSLK